MSSRSPTVFGPPSSQNAEQLHLLIETGLLLSSERSLDFIVDAVLNAGLHLSGARFGAFFYNASSNQTSSNQTKPYSLYQVVGLDPATFAALPLPRPTEILDRASFGSGVIRSADITQDPDASRYAQSVPHSVPHTTSPPGQTPTHPLIRSYLAVPVRSRAGSALGTLVYGHPEPNVFCINSEDLLATLASQAAAALDRVRLAQSFQNDIALLDSSRTLQRETALRLRQALDAAQLGTWTWDRSTDLLDLDERAAFLLNSRPHAPITRTELRKRVIAQDDALLNVEKLEQSLQSGALYSTECRVEGTGGGQTWVSASGIPTFASDSSIIAGMVGTIQDITSRKNQENALRQSEKLAATGRLAATIAHEINNPLEAVTNLIYLSRTDPGVPPAVQQLLKTADVELARVAQIAQQTLGFYRDTTLPSDIELNALLHNVVDLFARKMSSHKIKCRIDLEPALCIHGLQGEMRQVFSNLIVNAIDAFTSVSKAGCLHIRGRHIRGTANGVSILVSDEGTGIPLHVRDRVFSPFFTTKQSIGTGLGLWVTRSFVEKHGGNIRFRTRTGASSGTIFRVFLPSAMPKAQHTTH